METEEAATRSLSWSIKMVYFGDIYTCVKCKQAKGICIFDDIERPQDQYIELADKYIAENNAQVIHIPHDDWTCRSCDF